jgi:septal ring factor EnvC (AmiA/AmiB activator)
MRTPRASLATLVIVCLAGLVAAQENTADATRVTERIRALQQEAARLAAESKTLVGDLQKLEVERQLRGAEADQAERARSAAERELQATNEQLAALEQQRQAQLPALERQLVDLYKHGPGGNARLLFQGTNLRDFARTSRAVAALAAMNARRLTEHQKTIESAAAERAALETKTTDLAAQVAAARRARAAADQAVAARTALATQIDTRRDLTAQYVGELQVAYDRLSQQITTGGAPEPVAVPIAPFRGSLDWPVAGRIAARFGQTDNRMGGTAVKNGIDIAAAEGTPVRAVHGGTVRFADTFTGFGTLVILDHGGETYTLYGYLSTTAVTRGDRVAAGAELGNVGAPPGGMAALYFELRIDGRSVDPLQWLKAR